MNRLKKIRIISFILIALLCFGNAFAAQGVASSGSGGGGGSAAVKNISIVVDYSLNTVNISGTSGEVYKYRNVSLQVINPEKDIDDLFTEEDVLNWSDQGKTDEKGSFEFSYNIDGKTGDYTVIVGIDGNAKTYKKYFKYYEPNEAKRILEEINGYIKAKNHSGIQGIIATKADLLQINTSEYDDFDDDSQVLVCKGITESGAVTLNSFALSFEDAVKVQQINLTENEEDYTKAVKETADTPVADEIFDTLSDKDKTEIIGAMMEKEYTTKTAITTDYVTEVLLRKVKSVTVWGEMEKFITQTKDILGLDFTKLDKLTYKSSAFKLMLEDKDDFKSLEDIKDSFEDAVDEAKDNENSSGTSGGGGGGGGSKGGYKTPSVVPGADVPASNVVFADVNEAHWAREAIMALYEKNMVSGYGNNTFAPENNVTRAESLKMAIGLFGIEINKDAQMNFADVNAGDWYYDYVSTAYANNIVSGVSETEFKPNALISRQDMAVILYRAGVSAGKSFIGAKLDFEDKDEISEYAVLAVSAFSKAGVINGYNNKFYPADAATRAQASQIIYNVMKID